MASVDPCPICLEEIDYRKERIHRTECSHVFHAKCIAGIREFKCPCCRGEIQPELTQQIKILREDIKENNTFIKNQPVVYRTIIKTQNEKIIELENELRKAKETRAVIVKQQKECVSYIKRRLVEDKDSLYECNLKLASEMLQLKQWKNINPVKGSCGRGNVVEGVVKRRVGRPPKKRAAEVAEVEDEVIIIRRSKIH